MSSPEEVAEKAFGGKWKVTSLANEFEEGRKQGALKELKRLLKEHKFNMRFWKHKLIHYVAFYKDEIIKTKKRIKELEEGDSNE